MAPQRQFCCAIKNVEFYEQTNATNSMKKYVPVPKIFAHVWRGLALLGGAKRLGHTRVKIQRVSPYNFGTSENIPMKLFQAMCCDAGLITWVFWKALPLKFGRVKRRPNFCANSDNFRLWSRISLEGIDMSKNWKLTNCSPSHVGQKKPGELWSTYEKVIEVHIDPPKWTFSGHNISALKGRCALNFLHA